MARISSYDQDGTLNKLDKVIGTDSITGNTKNYTINSMLQLVNQEGLVEAFDGASFAFVDYIPASENPRGVINLNGGVATQANFSDINQLYISTVDKTGLSINEYLDNSLNNQIKVSLKGNMNQFGIYEVTAISSHDDGAYKILTLTPRAHNGILTVYDDFFLSNYSAVFDQNFDDNSVTEFGDVSDAGSGEIITDEERTSLNNFTNNGLLHGDVVDNVTSTSTDVPLSANQGKVLKDLIDAINTLLTSDNVDLDTLQEVVDYIETNRGTLDSLSISNITGLQAALDLKQNTEAGKGLSENDFTDLLLQKLNGIATGAQVNVKPSWTAVAGTDAEILNKPTDLTNLGIHDAAELRDVTSAGSGAIISNAERIKLNSIDVDLTNRTVTDGTASITVPPDNAEQNVNADWNATSGDAEILNKPALAPSNAEPNVQADWNATDSSSDAFILNKPALAPSNAEQNVQADWNEADNTSDAFIQNKPDVTVTKAKVDAALGINSANDTYFYQGDGTWASPASNIELGDLTDVRGDTTDPGTNEGYVLRWNPAMDKWIGASYSLENLYNVSTNQSNSVGKVLAVTAFNAQNSVNTYDAVELTIDSLGDFDVTNPSNNQILQYNDSTSHWENSSDLALPGTLEFTEVQSTTPSFDNGVYVSTEDGHDTMHFRYHGRDLSIDYLTENIPTGILNGGELSTNTSTTFDIAAGDGIINILNKGTGTDPHPEIKKIEWSDTTVTHTLGDANDADQLNTWVYVDQNGAIQQTLSELTPGIWRSNIVLGAVIHSSNTIRFVRTFPRTAYSSGNTYAEFVEIFGPLKKSGHLLTVNSTNTLALDRAAGQAFALGRNYVTDPLNPSLVSDGASTPVFHRYSSTASGFTKDNGVGGVGFTSIDPSKYDNNGTLTTVSGGNYSVQRLYHFPNNTNVIVAYYGKDEYASIDLAEKNYLLENFQEANNTATQAIFLGALIVKGNATDLSNASQAKILTGGIFRSLSAANLGGVAANSALSDLSDVTITSPTDGQVVKYNSTTGQFENQAEVGSIDGTGAANKLAIWSDTDTLTNDTDLHWNATNDRLGIGTASPDQKLHVVGNTKIEGTLFVEDTNNQIRLVDSDSSGNFSVGVNTHFQIRDIAGNTTPVTIQAGTPGSTLFLKSTGNVGIGTTSPSAKLHTVATGGTTLPTLGSSPDTAMLGGGLFGTLFSTLSSGKGVIQQGRTDGTATAYDLLLQPSGGNVGIGTSSPQEKLHVNSGTTNEVARFESTDAAAYLSLMDATTTYSLQGIGSIGDSLAMYSNNAERMRINSSGNVGIGTTSPTQKLEVNGKILLQNNDEIRFKDSGGTERTAIELDPSNNFNIGTSAGGNLIFINGSSYTERMRIDSSGNVGIGTTNPSVKLHVNGFTRINGGLQMNTANAQINQILDSALRFGTNSTERMRITNDGKVGIGTTSPRAKLEVKNGSTSQVYSNVEGILIDTNGNSNSYYGLRIGSSAGNDNLVVTNAGNVGIGTDQPTVSLDLGNNTDALQLPAGDNTARGNIANPFGGMIRYNTTDNQFEGYSGVGAAGSWGAIGGSGGGSGGSGEIVKTTFSATGSASFSLPDTIVDIDNVNVYVSGVYQYPSNYTVSGNTVTFAAGSIPTAGTDNVHIRHNVTATTLTEGAAFSTSGNLVGDGATQTFTLGGSPRSSDHVMVFLEGVYQEKENYSISGSNITFNTPPPNGYSIEAKYVTGVLNLTSVGEVTLREYVGDGNTSTYALGTTPTSEAYVDAYIEGVYQEKGTYSVAGSNIVFDSNIPNGYSIELKTTGTIPNSSVTQTTFVSDEFTANGSTNNFTLVNGSPSSKSLTMVFIQGVYQSKSNYNLVSGEIQFTATPDEDDVIEVISMSAVNTAGSPVTSVNGEVGAVTVASKHNVSVISANTTAVANTLYVFTANLNLTLPASPATGDSIKISNRSAVDTCQLLRNGNNILGAAVDLTLDTASSSFELVYTDTANGWVIIGQ